MSTITAIRSGKSAKKRINLFLDGKFAFSMDREKFVQERLKVGLELSQDRLDELRTSLKLNRCLDAAYHYLSYRPRSEAELRRRLQQRGFPEEHIKTTFSKLREQGLLDDVSFAKFWVENRTTFRPRSRGMTRSELRKKGVAEEMINQAVADIDEADSAYRAAISKARRLSRLDYPEFRQRLGDFLRRRGFAYNVISQTVRRVWQESKEQ